MVLFFLAYILLCLYGMKPHRKFDPDYLSVSNTQAVKGIFIILVFFSHFNSYVSFETSFDLYYKDIVTGFRQTMVTLFLFYSGYGVVESINKKGLPYLKQFPVKRMLSTLFKFICAVLIYFLVGVLALGERYTLPRVLFSLVGWESLGNSNWYIFVVLVLYLISWLSYRFLLNANRLIPLLLCVATVVTLIVLNGIYKVKPYYWVDTACCYVAGMLWAQYRGKIEPVINKHFLIYGAVTVLAFLATEFFKRRTGTTVYLIFWNLFFAGFVVLLTMRITLKNRFLVWCGQNLFELYILQRIPMILLKQWGVATINIYLYFVLCLTLTLFLVWPFKYITQKLWKLLTYRH